VSNLVALQSGSLNGSANGVAVRAGFSAAISKIYLNALILRSPATLSKTPAPPLSRAAPNLLRAPRTMGTLFALASCDQFPRLLHQQLNEAETMVPETQSAGIRVVQNIKFRLEELFSYWLTQSLRISRERIWQHHLPSRVAAANRRPKSRPSHIKQQASPRTPSHAAARTCALPLADRKGKRPPPAPLQRQPVRRCMHLVFPAIPAFHPDIFMCEDFIFLNRRPASRTSTSPCDRRWVRAVLAIGLRPQSPARAPAYASPRPCNSPNSTSFTYALRSFGNPDAPRDIAARRANK